MFSCNTFLFFLYSLSFSKKGFNVKSFGTGNMVKLPGPAPDKPNIYDFSITYDAMYRDLMQKDYELYPLKSYIYRELELALAPLSVSKLTPAHIL